LKEKSNKMLYLEHTLYSDESWPHRKIYQKYLTNFEKSCWRRIEKIGRGICVKREEELHRVKEERNILQYNETKEG